MSVFKRKDGRWVVEVYDKRSGRMKVVSPAKYGRKAPANRKEALALEAFALQASDSTTLTCREFALSWPKEYPTSWRGKKRSEATRELYHQQLKPFIEEFGDRQLGSIQVGEAREWAKRVPPSYVSCVRTMYSDAEFSRLVAENPFTGLGRNTSRGRADIQVLTPAEIEELAECARSVHGEWGNEYAAFLIWQAYTCMRPGETFAARWRYLDVDTYELREQWHHRLCKITPPKHNSVGTILVPPPVRKALATFPRRLDDDLIFHSKTGAPLRKGAADYAWKQVRAAFGPDRISALYELRHAGASYLLNDLGVEPWVIARQLRHSDGGMLVVKLYGHPQESEALRRIREAYSTAAKTSLETASSADSAAPARDYPF